MQQWSNNACYGYAILAAKRIGLTEQQISELIRAMGNCHDMKTIEEAKDVYCNSSN